MQRTMGVAIAAGILLMMLIGASAWMKYAHKPDIEHERTRGGESPGGLPFTQARMVIAGIEAYRANSMDWVAPESLDDLVPEYLQMIPKPGWGSNEWDYVPAEDGTRYYLHVRLDPEAYAGHTYFSEEGVWRFED